MDFSSNLKRKSAFQDPVIAADGQTYERAAIQTFQSHLWSDSFSVESSLKSIVIFGR